MKKYMIIAIVVLAGALTVSVRTCRKVSNDRDRLDANQRALFEKVTFYRTRDSLSAASVEKLTLSNSEFEKYNKGLMKTVDDLNLAVRRLESVSQTVTKTEYVIQTVFKDSVVYRDNKPDTLRCIEYHDAYLTFTGCEAGDTFDGRIESRDSLVTIVHRVPRKFLCIRWGTKAVRQEVVSRNPYSNITYTEYIELKKKK